MLSKEVSKLEYENAALRSTLEELKQKMEEGAVSKPKSCQYCKYYVQHYIKGGSGHQSVYRAIYSGHCSCGVPIKKGRKRDPKPDDTCPYFEMGTKETRYL